MIPIAWENTTTRELQNVIDEFTKEVLRRALDGEEEAIQMFAWRTANLANWLQALTTRQREKVERMAAAHRADHCNQSRRDRKRPTCVPPRYGADGLGHEAGGPWCGVGSAG